MNRTTLRLFASLLLLTAGAALADENEELVEKVAVRNRLFSVEGRFELGANVGFSFLPRLTDHYNLNISAAYNLKEWFALEARGGYAISSMSQLARQVQSDYFLNTTMMMTRTASEASDTWRLTGHGVLGIRFQPLYGKINLMSEVPVHFQAYLFVGGGVTGLVRDSMVQCPDRQACYDYLSNDREGVNPFVTESKVSPLVSLALGFRFFVFDHHSVKFEVRDWSYLDSYRTGFTRTGCTNGRGCATADDGVESPNAGITNLVQFDLGYSFLF